MPRFYSFFNIASSLVFAETVIFGMRNESFDFIAEGLIFLPYIYFDAQTSDYLVMITKKNNATNPITYFLGKII